MKARVENHVGHYQPRPAAVVDYDHGATSGNDWQLKSSNYRNHNVAVFRNGTPAHDAVISVQRSIAFQVPHPGSQTAAAELHQPGLPAAAVTVSEPARALPPTHSSLASMTAAASTGAAALSSELPTAGDRQAVAAIGSALVATADRDSMNAITLRVIAASSIAAKSSFVSARA